MAQSQGTRRSRAIVAVLLVGTSFAMATAVDYGVTRPWPDWARGLWAGMLILGMIAGVLLFANAVGALTGKSLAERGSPGGRAPSLRTFLMVYVGTLMGGVGLALYLERAHNVPGHRVIFGFVGLLFLLASSGYPWWLYESIRRVGWFAAIESDKTMRMLLRVIGLAAFLSGLFIPAE